MIQKLTALTALTTLTAAAAVCADPQLDKTYWNSNWNAMYFERNGSQVSSEYIHDKGVITATLSGDTLRGFWREYNNPQSCGPEGKWSGRVALLFDSTGKAFTGDWNYCGDSAALDLEADRWTGTWRANGYTEAECGAASRYWCNDACQLSPCDAALNQAQCLDFGRFWCNDACSLTQCSSSIRRVAKASPAQSRERAPKGLFDAQGRCLAPVGLPQGYFLQVP